MHQVLHAQEATVAIPETVVTTKLRPLDNSTVVRNLAVDAYRGLVMLLMMGEVLQFSKVYAYFNHSLFWKILAFNQTHTEWSGCSVHDMIQPSFSFLVGVALPYSIRSRQRKGAAFPKMLAHTVWRSLLLIALGIFLRSLNSSQTYFTFEDTLTQIGLGYTFLFLLAFRPTRDQWIAFGALLFGYWLAWALYPASWSELRLCRGRRSRGLASSIHRLSRPLEQEQQPWPGLRCVVPEPLSPRTPVRVQ